jgi:elongation factor G
MVTTDRLRNVALVGHSGNGKTSLVEGLLYRAGVIRRPGLVVSGGTVSDHDPEEKERQQSLGLTLVSFDWKGYRINLLDTPGYADFMGETYAALKVADLAVVVVDAVAGVQAQDEVAWRVARSWSKPRLVFINKLDRDRASYDDTLAQVRERFAETSIEPIELPIGSESSFHGVADLLVDRAFVYDTGQEAEVDIPPDMVDREHAEHEHLVEDIVEIDEALLEKYLEGEEPSPEELERALHEGLDSASLFPVLCGSATVPIGVDRLAEFICRVGPSPLDVPPVQVTAGGESVEVQPDAAGDPLLYVFKTKVDPYLGQLSLFKVLSGTISTDDTLVNPRNSTGERLHQLLELRGAEHERVGQVAAGDIAAVARLADTSTGDTLAPQRAPVRVEAAPVPTPVYGIAVRARTEAHEDKLATALRRLLTEDPSLSVRYEPSTRQTVLRGLGEVHVQVVLARLQRLGVEVETEPVQVAYLETLAGPADTEGKYKKQTGGHGQFGVANVRFEPLPRGAGFEFDDKVTGGAIPRGLIPAVSAGIVEGMSRGGKYGFPLVDLKSTCYDGKYHSVDSSEMSFKMAGSLALRAAIEQAGVVVLEPVSEVTVEVPSDLQGDIMGDLSSRRGEVLGADSGSSDGTTVVRAHVPTSEIISYALDLRSITGGRGTFSVQHHTYQPLPDHLLARL